MSEIVSDFISRASLRSVADAVARLNMTLPKRLDSGMPCPRCGGTDRFAVNPAKGVWNCRNCGGGKTGLGLVGHYLRYDLHRRDHLLEACSILLSEAIPEGGERETDQSRRDREAEMREALGRAEAEAAKQRSKQDAFREKEVSKARGIYLNATFAPHEDDGPLRAYLKRRTGFDMPDAIFENIRFRARHTYWHGQDERGNPVSYYVGFAMIAPFVDLSARVTGCHETWIDLSNGPKFRPDLGADVKGEPLPTKKMRGTKKGSLIPVCGGMEACRWIGGEGIETVAAFAGADGFRADTFYFATGDLGNLAGPADPKSAFYHPNLKKADVHGHLRPVRVQGPVPKIDQSTSDAYQVPDHVEHLIHLADGDSEPVFTASAMARAEARHRRDGRIIHTQWPPEGVDFALLMAGRRASGT